MSIPQSINEVPLIVRPASISVDSKARMRMAKRADNDDGSDSNRIELN